jgi:hypothetical protein
MKAILLICLLALISSSFSINVERYGGTIGKNDHFQFNLLGRDNIEFVSQENSCVKDCKASVTLSNLWKLGRATCDFSDCEEGDFQYVNFRQGNTNYLVKVFIKEDK